MPEQENHYLALCLATIIVAGLPLLCPALPEPGYEEYSCWTDWARVRKGVQTGLASSWDRNGGNYDFSHYEDPPGLITTLTTCTTRVIQGPGVIYRFWMPHRTSNQNFVVRMFFDGEATPRIDTTSPILLAGNYSYFSAPLTGTFAGGQICYEPIPFANGLRIETVNQELPPNLDSPKTHYYQYTYKTFPAGTSLDSYSGSLTTEQQAARAAVVSLFNNAGQHPAGDNPAAINVVTNSSSIPAGETLILAELTGPIMVRQINVKMTTATDAELDALRLRVSYDGHSCKAIDASMADFFGAGHQRTAYRSLPLGTDSPNGFYSYWPMPARWNIRIELFNPSGDAISIDSGLLVYEPISWTTDLACLHAEVNSSTRMPTDVYHTMLSTHGEGHYVGNLLYVQQANYSFTVLEGDEIITVDDSAVLHGTGLEDAYNGGYYYNWVGVQYDEPEGIKPHSAFRPLHGILYVNRDSIIPIAQADQYRWQIADRVSFTKSLEVKIENQYGIVGSQFRSVAFWYQLPVPADYDGDNDVDAADLAEFDLCVTGPDLGPPSPECRRVDLDADGDIDQSDFGLFQRCFCGPDQAADPHCTEP